MEEYISYQLTPCHMHTCILSMIEFNVFVFHFFFVFHFGGGDTHVYYYFVSRFCISELSSYMQRLWFGCLRNVGNRKKFYLKNICFFPSTFRRLYSQRGGLICGRIGQSHYFLYMKWIRGKKCIHSRRASILTLFFFAKLLIFSVFEMCV